MSIPVYFILMFLFACCSRNNDAIVIIPPVTSPLSQPCIGYAVVNVSYTQVNSLPHEEENNPSVGYLRQGAIVAVMERKIEKKGDAIETWVLVEGQYTGWIKESLVDIFENESQAQTASDLMMR